MKAPSLLAALLFVLTCSAGVRADEGMWPLYDLDKLSFDELKARGLSLAREEIYNPAGGGIASAVVAVEATGAFVSSRGLILTNHHVATDGLQRLSTVDQNFLRDGFYAASREEEIPAIGYHVFVPRSVQDVTERVEGALSGEMDDRARYEALERAKKEIIQEAESGRDVKCRIVDMLGGSQYILYTNFDIKDVRIVHAPPDAIGNFGGDIDNWMWPRHAGDYSFLRAYVAPDGSSAEYDKGNVPYAPPVWLPLSDDGIREDDFVFILGYPGKTDRYASSYYIEEMEQHLYPRMIGRLEEVLAVYEDFAGRSEEYALRLAENMSGLNNFLKNSYGMRDGLAGSGILARKRAEERLLDEFLRREPGLQERYGHVLPDLEAAYAERIKSREKDNALSGLARACELYSMASQVYKWSIEREKDNLERERGFQERDAPRARERLENAQINLLPEVDIELMRLQLRHCLELPADQRIGVIDSLFAGRTGAEAESFMDAWLKGLYAGSKLADQESRLAMFSMKRAELEALGDPFIDLAMALEPEMEALRERGKWFLGVRSRLEPQLIAAYAAFKQGRLYPDANSTLRFNWGNIKGYGPTEDPLHNYLTTLGGLMAKGSGQEPFIVPEPLAQAYKKGDFAPYADAVGKDVPVDFLTTNDSTGGNSGSPVLNGKGEIIGLLFDGNYESIAADYLFEPLNTRAICVDIRFVLFLIDKVYGDEGLMAELSVR